MNRIIKSLAFTVTALAAVCAHADVKLGYFGPLSGGSAPMGASALAGLKVAVAEINAAGGVNGEKIVLVERDDQAKNENGPLFAQEFIESERVAAVIGGCNTGVVLPAIPIYQEKSVVLMVPCASGAPITDPKHTFVFRTAVNDTLQTTKAIEALKAQGAKKIAVFADNTAYGKFGRDALIKAAAELNVAIVADETFAIGDKDMTSQLLKSKAAGAEGIVVWGIGPEVAVIAKQRVQHGFNIPMSTGWTASMNNFVDAAGKAGNGVRMAATFLQFSAKGAKQEAFVAAAVKEYGKPVIGTAMAAAQAYDAAYLWAAAATQAKSFDGKKVRDALESLQKPVVGIVRTYDKPFAAGQHDGQVADSVGLGVITDGKAMMGMK